LPEIIGEHRNPRSPVLIKPGKTGGGNGGRRLLGEGGE
jgi:hypothetical protein